MAPAHCGLCFLKGLGRMSSIYPHMIEQMENKETVKLN